MVALALVAGLSFCAWAWLVFQHGGFWRCDQRLGAGRLEDAKAAPSVTAVIPARNEADSIGETISGLLRQDYPGPLKIILVDDSSTDGTADVARAAADGDERLHIISNSPLPQGWSGKMWAVNAGLAAVDADADYVLLTDADIRHAPDLLSRLVAKAEAEGRVLVSLMVRLNCETFWEKLLIPAFVYYFQKLYPFRRVNDPGHSMAAAAGGCMLVNAPALRKAGGVEPIRDAIIDDCALAREMAKQGPIWLGLASRTVSLRRYDDLSEIWDMVARTAYTQLGYSPLMLLGSVAGMLWLYVLPPVALVLGFATGMHWLAAAGAGAVILMMASYLPILRMYGETPLRALTLPVAGLLYGLMTLSSGYRHWRGRGGGWKGRTYGTAGPSGGEQGSSDD